jgi:hypothetical protein
MLPLHDIVTVIACGNTSATAIDPPTGAGPYIHRHRCKYLNPVQPCLRPVQADGKGPSARPLRSPASAPREVRSAWPAIGCRRVAHIAKKRKSGCSVRRIRHANSGATGGLTEPARWHVRWGVGGPGNPRSHRAMRQRTGVRWTVSRGRRTVLYTSDRSIEGPCAPLFSRRGEAYSGRWCKQPCQRTGGARVGFWGSPWEAAVTSVCAGRLLGSAVRLRALCCSLPRLAPSRRVSRWPTGPAALGPGAARPPARPTPSRPPWPRRARPLPTRPHLRAPRRRSRLRPLRRRPRLPPRVRPRRPPRLPRAPRRHRPHLRPTALRAQAPPHRPGSPRRRSRVRVPPAAARALRAATVTAQSPPLSARPARERGAAASRSTRADRPRAPARDVSRRRRTTRRGRSPARIRPRRPATAPGRERPPAVAAPRTPAGAAARTPAGVTARMLVAVRARGVR